jgi:Sec-independent protein translocase protein TatA
VVDQFFEEQAEQSQIKAEIVTKYFLVWAKVIIASQKKFKRENRVAYIDLFAGSGRYHNGGAIVESRRAGKKCMGRTCESDRQRYSVTMHTLRDHHSAVLFDFWGDLGPQRRRLLEKSWAGVFREFLLKHLPVGELAPHFCDGFGRPSKDLSVALGALILQQLHDLTDEQTVEAIALNIAWHYALDIRHESDAYVCERTLRNYRQRILDSGLDQVVFRELTDRLIKAVGVDTSKQRLDSTAVRSAIRSLTRLGILVETVAKFLRELKQACPDRYAEVDREVLRKYVERCGNGCFANTRPSESKRRLPEAARDVYELLQQFRNTEAHGLASFGLLQCVFDEQCKIVDNREEPVVVKMPEEIPCDNVLNPADPDASYNTHRGVGYLVQIMETYSPDDVAEDGSSQPPKPDLITHVAVGKMTIHDRAALEPAIDGTAERGIRPKELLADSHYGSNECIEKGKQRDVEIVSPSMPAKGKQQGKLTLEDFDLDEDGLVLRCPEGHAPENASIGTERLQVTFSATVCEACPRCSICPVAAVGRTSPRYQYTHDRVRQRARRLKDATDGFRHRYRWRAGIEGTMSRYKHQMGMAKLRVRGRAKVTYAAFLRALGLNIHRVAAYRIALEAS